ncbi:unnamed protein product [Bursaphelenchus okinawaensis]|uniref:Uncharacterized protein n=1 Tax=Bursaphelenchus okinawaensis TaxID=465554 RepID=A0A811JUP1_9BILA|nr:unnamed protein product [Bursaphelenchus okinawaensis]CAG9083930.1 unnamed protein product [Bursaphelenchus okinawaensis]
MGILLSEDELPSDELLYFYKQYELVVLIVSVVLVVTTVAVMINSSTRSLNKYKWFLLHELVWSALFDIACGCIGAVTLFPIPCYYGTSYASSLSLQHLIVYFFVAAVATLGKVLPFVANFPNQADQRQYLSNLDPVLSRVFDTHPVLCFSNEINVTRLLIVCVTLIGVQPFLFFFALYFMFKSIKSANLSPKSQKLQYMLFWSLVAQISALVVFMIVPALFFFLGPILGLRNNPIISLFCFCVFILHTPADCIMIMYYIKPYRSSLIFNTCSTFMGCIVIFPVPCFYGVNVAGLLSNNWLVLYFFVGVNSFVGKVYAICLQFEHVYYDTLLMGSRYRYIMAAVNEYGEITFRVFIFLIILITINVPIVATFPKQHVQKSFLTNLDDVFYNLYSQYNLLCFTEGTDSTIVLISLLFFCSFIIFCFISALYFIYNNIIITGNPATLKLQFMFFRSLSAQMGVTMLVILVPGFFFCLTPIIKLPYLPLYSMACICLFNCHLIAECFMILYCIVPFRRFCIYLVLKIKKNAKRRVASKN